ncbi:hypothetical protein FGIG_04796 [Fasciola gigantica]|uniref:DUF5739 domain-containing protein n=1 Tax=Fasciola gigantica TaxID=46835 RepID=A0A504YJ45_FASGI|nr:hypothetical protein FGIG_04796 [Fasciola gigantica]
MNHKNENYNLRRTDKEFMSLMMLILISHKRTGTVYRHFPKLFIIICQIPLFIIPPTTCISLVKEKNRPSEVMKQKSSEALDFRPMNGSGLTPAPSHASKDTYYWNRPTPEELLLSYNQGRRSENFPQRFTKTTNSSTNLKETSHNKIGKPRSKTYNYRPNLWTSLKTENCLHRVFIRPSVISLENGDLHARIRYIIQLHRRLTGFYRLNMEVRTDPSYPPIYVGNIQNVCAHWPANLPQSNCSMNKSRFYQKGQICFCHMPPGIYRQRLRLNLTNILEGLEIPKFLVNFLFNGKEISIHLLIKLEDENDELVGCLNLTLPILLKSA